MINYALKQLYSFEAVVRLKSFTKASKELYITQPANDISAGGSPIITKSEL
jgi:hypothetical protein